MKRPALLSLGVAALLGVGVSLGWEWARGKAQQDLSRFLQIPVRVEGVGLSLRGFSLKRVTLSAGPAGAADPLRIERIELKGAPWRRDGLDSVTLTGLTVSVAGLPLRAQGRVFIHRTPNAYAGAEGPALSSLRLRSGQASASLRAGSAEGWLSFEHPLWKGRVEVSGQVLQPVVLGWLEWMGGNRRHFVGQWEFRKEAAELIRMDLPGGRTASGSFPLASNGQPSRLKLLGPEEEYQLQVEPAEDGSHRASLRFRREGQAPQEILARWAVQSSELEVEARLLGTEATVKGQISLQPPYPVALTLEMDRLDLAQVADWIPAGSSGKPPALAGVVRGRVEISGLARRPASVGDLSATDGRLGRLEFSSVSLRFNGTGPVLKVDNSHLAGPNGAFLLEGTVDLRRMGRPDFFRGMKMTSTRPETVRVAGWQMSLVPGSSGVRLRRTPEGERVAAGRPVAAGPAPVEARQLPGEPVGVRVDMDREEHFVGLEHRRRF